MNRTYTKAELDYENTKYERNWIIMGQTIKKENENENEYNLYATGDATLNGRIYIALPKGPISYEDKIKYNIM